MAGTRCDVLVVGGGPAGSTAACLLARQGLSVLLCERERFPRFHIGESLLPYTSRLWRRLGIYGQLQQAGFQPKWGARFYFEPGEGCTHLDFEKSLDRGARQAFNVRRADFDHLLLKNAAASGVRVLEGHEIDALRRDGERIVGARARDRESGETFEMETRFLIDATGRDTLLGGALALKERDPLLRQVSMFRHFRGARMGLGRDGGDVVIVGGPFGWFWMIPLDAEITSVGIVCPGTRLAERGGRSLEAFFADLIAESREVGSRLEGAEPITAVEPTADFSYRCARFFGEGWALAGDAAAFLDPIFSSGVLLAMRSGERLADTVAKPLRAGRDPRPAELERYQKFVQRGLDHFRRYILGFYEPGCASVFRRRPPAILQSAGVSAFAGKVFERDLRVGLFDLAFFSRAALNRKAVQKGEWLPAAPACDVTEKERLCRSLPFGKIGCAPAAAEAQRTLK